MAGVEPPPPTVFSIFLKHCQIIYRGGQLYTVYILFTSLFCSVSGRRKVQPPANFSQFKHCLATAGLFVCPNCIHCKELVYSEEIFTCGVDDYYVRQAVVDRRRCRVLNCTLLRPATSAHHIDAFSRLQICLTSQLLYILDC